MKTRMVEAYFGYGMDDFGTWDTAYVDIPADTPEDKIKEATEEAAKAYANNLGVSFAFCGLYSDHLREEEEDEIM